VTSGGILLFVFDRAGTSKYFKTRILQWLVRHDAHSPLDPDDGLLRAPSFHFFSTDEGALTTHIDATPRRASVSCWFVLCV